MQASVAATRRSQMTSCWAPRGVGTPTAWARSYVHNLSTRYSFTMYCNLQTEPGRWNHLIVPEAIRIFDWQRGLVQFGEISDPALATEVAAKGEELLALLEARRIASNTRLRQSATSSTVSPDRRARGLSSALGAPLSEIEWGFGGLRPVGPEDTCRH